MKRLCEFINLNNYLSLSNFQNWEYGIHNTGKNFSGNGYNPLNYYIIADDNLLEGL